MEDITFSCSICNSFFYTIEKFNEHKTMHNFVSNGTIVNVNNEFFCKLCYANHYCIKMNSSVSVAKHLKMHEQLSEVSHILKNPADFCCILCETNLKCSACLNANMHIKMCIGNIIDKFNCTFDDVPSFIRHFESNHLMTSPEIIRYNWIQKEHCFKVKQCSFCGCAGVMKMNNYATFINGIDAEKWSRIHDYGCCIIKYQMLHKELIAKKSVLSLITCHWLVRDENNCLNCADEDILKQISRYMV